MTAPPELDGTSGLSPPAVRPGEQVPDVQVPDEQVPGGAVPAEPGGPPVPVPPLPVRPGPQAPAADWGEEAPPGAQAVSVSLTILCALLLALLVNLTGISQLEHLTSQAHLYSKLRLTLAEGSTPVSPVTASGQVVPLGTPVAVLRAPTVGISREVIVEGSGAGQTMEGIGHRRDTVLPCQVGSSVLMARSGAYGGVGAAFARMQNGDRFTVTMGQGTCTYQVSGRRVAGDPAPPPPTGRGGALTLVTATGYPFAPTGVLRVDATLVSKSFDSPAVVFPPGSLPASEQAMGVDTSQLFPLVMLAEALVALAVGAVWLGRRWGAMQTFIVLTAPLLACLFLTAHFLDYLLPNLI